MNNKATQRFGYLEPLYNFSLNPYPDIRFTSCLICHKKTAQRKIPLIIHVYPKNLIALNYTNRYCKNCDILIAHKHEIEHHLTELFLQLNPDVIGNKYLIFGTIEKKAWLNNIKQPKPLEEMRSNIHDFKTYEEIRVTMAGWFPKGITPPVMDPAPSREWIKTENSGRLREKSAAH